MGSRLEGSNQQLSAIQQLSVIDVGSKRRVTVCAGLRSARLDGTVTEALWETTSAEERTRRSQIREMRRARDKRRAREKKGEEEGIHKCPPRMFHCGFQYTAFTDRFAQRFLHATWTSSSAR